MDYELYNYGSHSEIRAIPENGPQQLVATFPDHDAACIGWDQIMDAIDHPYTLVPTTAEDVASSAFPVGG